MIRSLLPRYQGSLLTLIVVLCFWAGLSGDFLFDDYHNIVTNAQVRVADLNLDTLLAAGRAYSQETGLARPLPTMWFAVDHWLGGGAAWIFKVNGLLVHVFNAWLVLLLLRRVLALPAVSPENAVASGSWTCFVLALIWAIHPLQVSTVLYVVQRMETLSLAFVLMGLLAYLAGRRRQIEGARGWPLLLLCLPLWMLALLAKESALLFAAYLLALECTVLGFRAHSAVTARRWRWVYAIAGAAALAVFVFWAIPRYAGADDYAMRDFTVFERLLTQCRVLPMYLGQILLPLASGMTFYYDDFTRSRSLFDPPTTALGLLLIAALLGSAIALRRRAPLYALGILWFFAAHALTSNIVALEMVFEHRNYFALLGVIVAVYDIARRMPLPSPRLRHATVGLLLVGLAALTLTRSATWGDPFVLATDLVAKRPGSARASSDLAALYYEAAHGDPASPHFARAMSEFERASRLPRASSIPEYSMIAMLLMTEQKPDDRLWQRLIDKIGSRPIGSEALASLNGLLDQSETGRAVDPARMAEVCALLIADGRQQSVVYFRCGAQALYQLHDEARAERLLREAVRRSGPGSKIADAIRRMLIDSGHQSMADAIVPAGQ